MSRNREKKYFDGGYERFKGWMCVVMADEGTSVGESQSYLGTIIRPGAQREAGLASGI